MDMAKTDKTLISNIKFFALMEEKFLMQTPNFSPILPTFLFIKNFFFYLIGER